MPHARARGFTLIEMLLAVSILAFIMAMIYSGLSSAIRTTETGTAEIDRNSKIRITHEFLRHQLNRILNISFAQDRVRSLGVVFEGDSRKIRFVAPMPGYLGSGGPYVQELEIAGSQLLYRFWLLNGFDADKIDRSQKPLELLKDIRRAEFSFRSVDNQNKITDWTKRWQDSQFPPVVIRLNIEFKPESKLRWPDLVVPMLVDANVMRQSFGSQFNSSNSQ
jgi:general secretion pathway protein J